LSLPDEPAQPGSFDAPSTVLSESTATPEVRLYQRSAIEVAALRRVVDTWQTELGFWSFDNVLQVLARPGTLVLYAPGSGPDWEGVILADVGHDSAEVWYIYVVPEARTRGVARRMMRQLIALLQKKPHIGRLFLEVRLSNLKAIALYESLGMRRQSVRKRYYANGEDALVFRLDLHQDVQRS